MASKGAVVAGVALGAVVVTGAIILIVRRKTATAPAVQTGTDVKVEFSGISGGTSASPDGYLPDLVTTITNTAATAEVFTIAASTGAFPWLLDTRAGHGLSANIAPASSTLNIAKIEIQMQPGETITLPWTAQYHSSYGQGPFTNTLTVEVGAMPSQTFSDSATWALSVTVTPAQAEVTFSGGPSTQTIAEGSNATLPTLSTVLTNTGQASATFTMTCAISGPTAARWYVSSAPSNVTKGDFANVGVSNSGAQVTLAGGASVTIQWSTVWDDAQPAEDGTYTNVASVSW